MAASACVSLAMLALASALHGCSAGSSSVLDGDVVDVLASHDTPTSHELFDGADESSIPAPSRDAEDALGPIDDLPGCEAAMATALESTWGGSVETSMFSVRVQFINRNHQGGLLVRGDVDNWTSLHTWFKPDGLEWEYIGFGSGAGIPSLISPSSYLIGYWADDDRLRIGLQDGPELRRDFFDFADVRFFSEIVEDVPTHSHQLGRFVCIRWPGDQDRTCRSLDGGQPWTVTGVLMGGPFLDWALLYSDGDFQRLDLRVDPPAVSPAPWVAEATPPTRSAQSFFDDRLFIESEHALVAYREFGDPEVLLVKEQFDWYLDGFYDVMPHGWLVFGYAPPWLLPLLRAPGGGEPTSWTSNLQTPQFHWFTYGKRATSSGVAALSGYEQAPECACVRPDGVGLEGRRVVALRPESTESMKRLSACSPVQEAFWPTAEVVAQWNPESASGAAIVTTLDPTKGEAPHFLDALSGEGRLEAIYWLETDRLWNVAIPGLMGPGTGIVSRCDIAGAFEAGGVVIQCLINGDVVSTALWRDGETFRFSRIAQRPGDWTHVSQPGPYTPTSRSINTRSGRCIGLSGGPGAAGDYEVDVACFPPEE